MTVSSELPVSSGARGQNGAHHAESELESAYLPWFQPADFEAGEFDPNAYIKKVSGQVSLEGLQELLKRQLGKLRAELVDVINEDYSEFLGLTQELCNVDGAVVRLQAPLIKLQESLTAIHGRYQDEMQALHAFLERQSQVHHVKSMLELVQDASGVICKVESLAADLPDPSTTGSKVPAEDLAAHANHLERIASEVSRLNFYLGKGAALPVMNGLKQRLSDVMRKLEAATVRTFTAALQAPHTESIAASCVHTAVLIGDTDLAHGVVRDALVRPALEAACGHIPTDASVGLSAAVDAIRAALDPLMPRLSALAASTSDASATQDSLGICVLSEIHDLLARRLPDTFSAADPDAFRSNYGAAMGLLDWLESHTPSAAAKREFRIGAARTDFVKAWNLPVYYSLRFQDIGGRFEEAVHGAPQPAQAGTGQQQQQPWMFSQTADLVAALMRCRAPDVAFPAVYDRFFKLQLQLILRYGSWLREAGSATTSNAASSGGTATAAAAAGDAPPPHKNGASDFRGFDAGGMRIWAKDASSEDALMLLADVWTFVSYSREDLAPSIVRQLSDFAKSDLLDQIPEAVERAVRSVTDDAKHVLHIIVKHVLRGASTWLRHVKSIAATYRMTSRPPPSKPSHYVSSLLKPAVALKDTKHWSQVPDAVQAKLLCRAIDDVAASFHDAAKELLETAERTQASLSKLGRMKAGAGAAAGASGGQFMSDIDKIRKQLELDVLEFAREAEELHGASKVDCDALKALLALVATDSEPEIT